MTSSKAATVSEYLQALDPVSRKAVQALRRIVRAQLPAGYRETMQHGMISYIVPPKRTPVTYNGQPLVIAAIARQKQHIGLYLMGTAAKPAIGTALARTVSKWPGANLGKSCLNMKNPAVIADATFAPAVAKVLGAISPDEWIAHYESAYAGKKLHPLKGAAA